MTTFSQGKAARQKYIHVHDNGASGPGVRTVNEALGTGNLHTTTFSQGKNSQAKVHTRT